MLASQELVSAAYSETSPTCPPLQSPWSPSFTTWSGRCCNRALSSLHGTYTPMRKSIAPQAQTAQSLSIYQGPWLGNQHKLTPKLVPTKRFWDHTGTLCRALLPSLLFPSRLNKSSPSCPTAYSPPPPDWDTQMSPST